MNFDYLRLLLAMTVMLVHLKVMPNGWPLWNSEVAVLAFFCISGFLITQSYMRSASLEEYFKKRVCRIYPPIVVVVVMLSAVGLLTGAGQPFFRGLTGLLLFQDWLVLADEGTKQGVYGHGAFWS